ncbi:MAG: PAS domain S-box protein [Methanocalculus sp.]|uniref:PAS domain S-box protein n=1 Tax=Methanocalculus sp. TaxID=2004547 RepID=UPI00271C0FB8|nr:PAS domain S-box protein [Methanocalculus sp.]MDO9539758.1 PAS domain S-box protein [Methanocalculus sp.]
MAQYRVWIVEDESIVAMDLKARLERMGYTIPGISSYGEDAIEKVRTHRPDLVLMDIVLKGEMDGITAAGIIRNEMEIPVVYLTAYADEKTIGRAKVTEPYGYILKPFEERDVLTVIEIALYKASMEKRLRESERWISTTIKSMGEGIIATDIEGMVKFMNPVAEHLTGMTEAEAIGNPSSKMFSIEVGDTGRQASDPVLKALKDQTTVTSDETMVLISHDGTRRYVEYTAAPIRDDRENLYGAVLIFRDITGRIKVEEELRRHREHLEEIVAERTTELRKANAKLEQMINYINMTEQRWAEEMLLSEVSCPDKPLLSVAEGVISIDRDMQIVLINHFGEEITGWRQEEAADQPVSSILNVVRPNGEILECPLNSVFESGEVQSIEEGCLLVRRSNEKIPVRIKIEPIRDHSGEIIGATISIRRIE